MNRAFGVQEGDRVRLISMDDPDPIKPGSTGTVVGIYDGPPHPQIWVKWDKRRGLNLNLIPGVDHFELLPQNN